MSQGGGAVQGLARCTWGSDRGRVRQAAQQHEGSPGRPVARVLPAHCLPPATQPAHPQPGPPTCSPPPTPPTFSHSYSPHTPPQELRNKLGTLTHWIHLTAAVGFTPEQVSRAARRAHYVCSRRSRRGVSCEGWRQQWLAGRMHGRGRGVLGAAAVQHVLHSRRQSLTGTSSCCCSLLLATNITPTRPPSAPRQRVVDAACAYLQQHEGQLSQRQLGWLSGAFQAWGWDQQQHGLARLDSSSGGVLAEQQQAQLNREAVQQERQVDVTDSGAAAQQAAQQGEPEAAGRDAAAAQAQQA